MRDLTFSEIQGVFEELSDNEIAAVTGGDGGVRESGTRSIVAERNTVDGWSGSDCETLSNINAAAGMTSFVSALVPGGQAVSLVSGGGGAMGTALYYQNCY